MTPSVSDDNMFRYVVASAVSVNLTRPFKLIFLYIDYRVERRRPEGPQRKGRPRHGREGCREGPQHRQGEGGRGRVPGH